MDLNLIDLADLKDGSDEISPSESDVLSRLLRKRKGKTIKGLSYHWRTGYNLFEIERVRNTKRYMNRKS